MSPAFLFLTSYRPTEYAVQTMILTLLYMVLWSLLVFSPRLWTWRGKAGIAPYSSLHLSLNTIKICWINVCEDTCVTFKLILSVNYLHHELFVMLYTSWESWRTSCYGLSLPDCGEWHLSNLVSQMQKGLAFAIGSVIPGERSPCLFHPPSCYHGRCQHCFKVPGFSGCQRKSHLFHCHLIALGPTLLALLLGRVLTPQSRTVPLRNLSAL